MNTDKPTIYLTNWSSHKLHGDGKIYTIMARPRHWEHGDGIVKDLVPDECHRVWAANLLVRNGWRVVLDGEVLA